MDSRTRSSSTLCPKWLPTVAIITALLQTANTADISSSCAIQRYKAAFHGGFIPNCSPGGGFEPIQCYESKCWCVEKDTGKEIANTKINSPSIPNCDYPALRASEVDLMKAVIKNKGDDIVFTPNSFNGIPSYDFQSSDSVYALAKDYLPPNLWPNFSILATVKPMSLEGGFLFAVVDNLESILQLAVGIAQGPNEYTQNIDLWYTENHNEKGSVRIVRFTVPVMVGKWSRFAIGVNGTSINLHVYCQQDYAVKEYKRSHTSLKFVDDSYLLVGHGGEVFKEPFKGDIQELRLTGDPMDAAKQCEVRKDDKKKQESPLEREVGSGAGNLPHTGNFDNDNEPGDIVPDPTGGSGGPGRLLNKPFDPNAVDETTTIALETTTTTAAATTTQAKARVPAPNEDGVQIVPPPKAAIVGIPGEKGEPGPKGDAGEIGSIGLGIKGEKGEPGSEGMPGKHGVNGIPGMLGAIGPAGLHGEQGKKGDQGVGKRGPKGAPGKSVKGESGTAGSKGDKGEAGRSIIGPKGEQGKSFFAELEEKLAMEGSGEREEDDDVYSRVPALELLRGAKGAAGNCTALDGLPGKDGAHGKDGLPGVPGSAGPRGAAGERGASGAAGDNGESGDQGEQGTAGPQGDKGAAGARGLQGLQGPPGPAAVITSHGAAKDGQPGERGLPGVDGVAGEKGEQGKPGQKGDKGKTGAKGPEGKEGPQGAPGLDGRDGAVGAAGLSGVDGANGTKGDKGPLGVGQTGPPGPPGPPGPESSKALSVGELNKEPVPGVKGDKGDAGTPGKMDYNELVSNILPLFKEKGDKGDQGVKGKDGGCKMCVGFKGSRGRRGVRGIKGNPGVDGAKGELGTPGFPGENGIPGAPGTPGDSVKGERGETGDCNCSRSVVVGLKGMKGEPGVTASVDGQKVVQGPPGPPGPPGQTIVGLQGPPGPRGQPGRDISSSVRSSGSLGGVLMFPNQVTMTSSSLAIPSGTLGFVMDQQRLYIRVNMGWQAISVGPVIPMNEGEFANSLPNYLQETPSRSSGMRDAAAASGNNLVLGVLRLFALNTPFRASEISGVSTADYRCYKQARRAKVSGTFRAVLTSRLQSIESLVFLKDKNLAITNSKGQRLLESWSGVTKNKGYWVPDVPIYTFDGADIRKDNRWKHKYFWHGAKSTGEADTTSYCQAWTSGSRKELGASSSLKTGQLLDKSLHTCDTKLAVLCIETTLPENYRQR